MHKVTAERGKHINMVSETTVKSSCILRSIYNMVNNRQIISTIKITVLGCDAVRFGRDESRKKPAASISMLKMKAGMYCEILVHVYQNIWRLILENSNSVNQR
jgi:hypothetical protein